MIPFLNLQPQHGPLAAELNEAAARVLASGRYILGPELEAFESELAQWHGSRHAVGVASGTDAVELALRGCGLGPGDEVITVAHTAVATVCGIERAGCTPVLVDIDPQTYNISVAAAQRAVTPRTRAIVAVHLYGQAADLDPLVGLARARGLKLIEDCAQAWGARYGGQRVGRLGDAAAVSLYPTKNLGACGDGGAVLTDQTAVAERIRRLRFYGQKNRDEVVARGMNSRLDELQAALLRVKLPHLDSWLAQRQRMAAHYDRILQGVRTPHVAPDRDHTYHLYVVRHLRRDALMGALARRGVGTLVHYPVPVHLQPAYRFLGLRTGDLPETEAAASQVLSLPLWIGLTEAAQTQVAAAVAAAADEVSR